MFLVQVHREKFTGSRLVVTHRFTQEKEARLCVAKMRKEYPDCIVVMRTLADV